MLNVFPHFSPFFPIFPHFPHFSHFSVAQKRLGDSGVGDFQGLLGGLKGRRGIQIRLRFRFPQTIF